MTKQNGRYEVSGVVSFGKGCAEPFRPGVYANTFGKLKAYFVLVSILHLLYLVLADWIESTTGSGECLRG